MASLPIIDFTAWRTTDQRARHRIAHDLTSACRRVGFVYITNHGLPDSLLEQAFSWSKRLFDLPQDQKMLAPHPPGPDIHRGYSWPGLEKVSQYVHQDGANTDDEEAALRQVEDCKESYEIGSEECIAQPNQWLPEEVLPGFREFMMGFYWECFGVARELLRALAVGIALEHRTYDGEKVKNNKDEEQEQQQKKKKKEIAEVEEYILRHHSGHNNQLRLLHYPPIETERLSSNTVARMPAHTDWGSITLLFQDECGGLQVEDVERPGEFVHVAPIKGALVMNVGDLLMRWSNDYLKSTMHRVSLPPQVAIEQQPQSAMTKARYSIPYFVTTDPTSLIECIPACTSQTNPPKYAPILQKDYGKIRAQFQYRDTPEAASNIGVPRTR